MKVKFINIATALIINFGIACLIDYITNHGTMRWWFIIMWAVIITFAQLLFMKNKKASGKKAKP